VRLLKKQLDLGDAKNASFCDIIMHGIAKVLTTADKKSSVVDDVREFADVFADHDQTLGCTPAALIASLVAPQGNFSSSQQNEGLYMAVLSSLRWIAAASDQAKEALRRDPEAFTKIKLLQTHNNPQLSQMAKELYDLVLPPITQVDELD